MPSRAARWATREPSWDARGSQLIVHRVRVTQGRLRENEEVAVSVESRRRQGLKLHHTGTHLLHAALRKILGTHVAQAGSLVAPDHLRFDFSHGAAVKDSEVEKVEDLVNENVQANIVVTPAEMDLQEALKSGAMALFGEKYGDRVRVIRIGDFSTELCGGTHLEATGQIGLFKVVSEGAVASGVRRVEAVTGDAALRHVGREEQALRASAGLLKIPPLELPRRLQKLLEEQKQLEKQLQQLEARLAKGRAQELATSARVVAGVPVLAARLDGLDAEGLRSVVDTLRERMSSGVICLGSSVDGKVTLVASVSKDLTKRFAAGKLVQEVAPMVGGKGGGRPDLAPRRGPGLRSRLGRASCRGLARPRTPRCSSISAARSMLTGWRGRSASPGSSPKKARAYPPIALIPSSTPPMMPSWERFPRRCPFTIPSTRSRAGLPKRSGRAIRCSPVAWPAGSSPRLWRRSRPTDRCSSASPSATASASSPTSMAISRRYAIMLN